MPSSYSNLKIELIGTGEQDGTWGITTNNNLQYALEEAITGSSDVTFSNADVTLVFINSNLPQTARNLRLNLLGVASVPLNLIVPQIEKLYLITNNLANAITVKTAVGTGVAVAAGKSCFVFNNGVDIYDAINYLSTLTLGSPLPVSSGGTGQTSGTGSGLPVFQTSPTLTTPDIGTPSAGVLTSCTGLPMTTGVTGTLPIGNGGTNTTATPTSGGIAYGTGTALAYLAAGTTNQILQSNGFAAPSWIAAPGTIYTQNSNNVSITGGTITGITDLTVADGGTGASSITANSVILGNGTSALSGNLVAPSTTGNVLTSNGTTWQSTAPTTGIGVGQTWQNFTTLTRVLGTTYTNSTGKPIMIILGYGRSSGLTVVIGGVTVATLNHDSNNNSAAYASFIVPTGATYSSTGGYSADSGAAYWSELR